MNDTTTELRFRQWARVPPAEILAVVAVAPVPDIPPISLRDVLEPLMEQRRIIGWKLSAAAALRPGLLAEFWSWRRLWTASWSMGPVTNVRALVHTASQIGHDLGAELRGALDRMCRAENDDEAFTMAHADRLLAEVEALSAALATASATERGAAIIDDTGGSRRASGVLRTWAPPHDELVLAATSEASVLLRRDDGLVILHGDPLSLTFRNVAQVDLTGDLAVIVNESGERLEMRSAHARPIAWLAPNSVRWHVQEIPLVEVWTRLLRGLPDAVSAACLAETSIRFTSDVTAM